MSDQQSQPQPSYGQPVGQGREPEGGQQPSNAYEHSESAKEGYAIDEEE
ncbi:hypothetical protein [Sphingomicrobium arenosum]|nr:hypothetical protein [Sphingomicrobium arenosum]